MNRLEHAKSCSLHPSKLTFQHCSQCGKPICQVCKNMHGICPKCESESIKQKSNLLKKLVPSRVNIFLTLTIMALFALMILLHDTPEKTTSSLRQSSTQTPDTSPSISGGAFGKIPSSVPSFYISEKIELVNEVAKCQQAPFKIPHGYPYAVVPDILNPPFQVVPYQLSLPKPFKPHSVNPILAPTEITIAEGSAHQNKLAYHAPYRFPRHYPYALLPDVLNSPFQVVPYQLSTPKPFKPHSVNPIQAPTEITITEDSVQNINLAYQGPYRFPCNYPYALVPDILNPPFLVVPVLLSQSKPFEPQKANQIQAVNQLPIVEIPVHKITLAYHAPYRNACSYPYALVPEILNPSFQVTPQAWPRTLKTELSLDQGINNLTPPSVNKEVLVQTLGQQVQSKPPPEDQPVTSVAVKPNIPNRSTTPKRKRKPSSNSMANYLLGGNRFRKYNLESIPTKEKIITLSFDGDHIDNCLIPVLNILEEKDIKVNIFLTGKFIKLFPDGVNSLLDAGHEIGNHTWNHPHLTEYEQTRIHKTHKKITRQSFLKQLQRASNAYQAATGKPFNPFWRAPYGEHNLQIRTWAYSAGYLHIGWTRGYDTMDWMVDPKAKYYLSPSKILKRLMDHLIDPGHKIVLMHLGSKREASERPYQILGEFIDQARKEGYRFTTISEVLRTAHGFQMASREIEPEATN